MAKLIDKDKLLAGIDSEIPATLISEYKAGLFRARLLISEAPLVPAQEVRYGKWEQLTEYEDGRHCRCSECGREFELEVGTAPTDKYNLCPVCGAYMQHGRNRIRLEDFCDILRNWCKASDCSCLVFTCDFCLEYVINILEVVW